MRRFELSGVNCTLKVTVNLQLVTLVKRGVNGRKDNSNKIWKHARVWAGSSWTVNTGKQENMTVVHSYLTEGLVMKPCYENNGAAIYVGRAVTVHNPLF